MTPEEQRRAATLIQSAADLLAEHRKQQSGNVAIWVWVASLCCAMCLALSITLATVVVLLGQEIRALESELASEVIALKQADTEQQAYLAALYARSTPPTQENSDADPDHP